MPAKPTVSIFIRTTPDVKEALQAACDKLAAKVPGAKLHLQTFLVQAGLEKARLLGVTVPGGDTAKRRRG
jgi:hypothetical protein